jgi:orotate phosphoribosyltransferase-like protein
MKAKRGVSADPAKIQFYQKRLVDEGAEISDIARELNVSKQAVSVFANKHFLKKVTWALKK